MKTPNYIYHMNDAEIIPKKSTVQIIARVVAVIALVLCIFSFSWACLLILIGAGIMSFCSGTEDRPTPVEIHFYDDRLVVHHPKLYYNKRVTRKEWEEIRCDDVEKCYLHVRYRRFYLLGDVRQTWYNYNADGTLPEKPDRDNRLVKGTQIFIRTRFASHEELIQVIEENSPLRVFLENQ